MVTALEYRLAQEEKQKNCLHEELRARIMFREENNGVTNDRVIISVECRMCDKTMNYEQPVELDRVNHW